MILITGATGFLGQHLVDEFLASGYEVRVLVRNAAERNLPWGKLVEVIDGDILDVLSLGKAVNGVDAVVHSAAMVSFWPKKREELMKVNVEGTANVVNACLDEGVPQLVHVSSIAAIGNSKSPEEFVTENTPWLPEHANSGYALSKRKAEMEIHRGISEGLSSAVMVNPGLIMGKGDWTQGTPKMFSVVDKGLTFYSQGIAGVVGAEDVAKACRLVLEKETSHGERFLLAAENIPYQELFQKIAKYLGKKPPSIRIPKGLALFAGKAAEMAAQITQNEPLISSESMRSGMNTRHFDGSKITQLGLEYTPVEEVIRKTAEAYLRDMTGG
ncbi:MAG: NAD-dependent epimerase/dehydratase family protein [Bacteroidetes bacterium]|nr:NAD-dependent epimerase/dehydratase family protein [Bacteroidota bacterium]